jgi:hypothetical protein
MPHWEWDAPAALAPWIAGLAASTDEGEPPSVRLLPDGGSRPRSRPAFTTRRTCTATRGPSPVWPPRPSDPPVGFVQAAPGGPA